MPRQPFDKKMPKMKKLPAEPAMTPRPTQAAATPNAMLGAMNPLMEAMTAKPKVVAKRTVTKDTKAKDLNPANIAKMAAKNTKTKKPKGGK